MYVVKVILESLGAVVWLLFASGKETPLCLVRGILNEVLMI